MPVGGSPAMLVAAIALARRGIKPMIIKWRNESLFISIEQKFDEFQKISTP